MILYSLCFIVVLKNKKKEYVHTFLLQFIGEGFEGMLVVVNEGGQERGESGVARPLVR